MKIDKIFKFIFIVLIITFAFMMFASRNGYYEYQLSKKTQLTEESIKKFEKDIETGKSIDINDYITDKNNNYDNKVSRLGNKISTKLEDGISKCFDLLFKYLNNQIESK